MKGTSRVIMGATLAMVVILAIVLALILILLAELYCSLLLRPRRQLLTTVAAATAAAANNSSSNPQSAPTQPLRTFYSHGVLAAPRSLLFPAADHGRDDTTGDLEKQLPPSRLHQFFESKTQSPPPEKNTHQGGSPSCPGGKASAAVAAVAGGGGGGGEGLVYISNPIYDNNADAVGENTPFETPDTSPSRLESGGTSSEELSPVVNTPPLTPMKKLPAEACSVSLRSLVTSGSDSNSNNFLSSSSSGSPCTSPSW